MVHDQYPSIGRGVCKVQILPGNEWFSVQSSLTQTRVILFVTVFPACPKWAKGGGVGLLRWLDSMALSDTCGIRQTRTTTLMTSSIIAWILGVCESHSLRRFRPDLSRSQASFQLHLLGGERIVTNNIHPLVEGLAKCKPFRANGWFLAHVSVSPSM